MKRTTDIAIRAKRFVVCAIFAFFAVSCGKLDVVGSDSVRAFNEILKSVPQLVSEDSSNGGGNGGWSISAPDNNARFIWSKNFVASPNYDVMLEFNAAPFIEAGLIPEKLPDIFAYRNGMLTLHTIPEKPFHYEEENTPLASYKQLVKLKRSSIGYHGQLDHYGISLENGNMFEWAKNMTTNDKDIVFVLNPDPFIAAGTDVAQIDGWVFGKVTVDDENGKPVQVDKLLKPFNLK